MVPRRIDASTKIIAIIGDPVEHSKTPIIQNAALERLGLNVVNIALRVPEKGLKAAVAGGWASGFLGMMVTIPHKVNVLSYAHEVDPQAQVIGAANLLQYRSDGKIVAYNTDAYGARQSFVHPVFGVKGKRILILGAGGAARTIAVAFLMDGAQSIKLANRTKYHALQLAQDIEKRTGRAPQMVDWVPSDIAEAARQSDILINTTSVGMYPNANESPVTAAALRKGLIVFDTVYNPMETKLLEMAKQAGAHTVDGIDMLVHTNEMAVEILCGVKPDVAYMREVCVKSLSASPGEAGQETM